MSGSVEQYARATDWMRVTTLPFEMQSMAMAVFRWTGVCPWIYSTSFEPKSSASIKLKLSKKSSLCLFFFLTIGHLPYCLYSIHLAGDWINDTDRGFTVVASYFWTMLSVMTSVIVTFSLIYHSRGIAVFFHLVDLQSKGLKIRVRFSRKEKLVALLVFLLTWVHIILIVLRKNSPIRRVYLIVSVSYLVEISFAVFVPLSFYIFCKFLEKNLRRACRKLLAAVEVSSSNHVSSSAEMGHSTQETLKAARHVERTLLWNEFMKNLLMKYYSIFAALVFFYSFVSIVNCTYFSLHDYLRGAPLRANRFLLLVTELIILSFVNFPADDYNNTVSWLSTVFWSTLHSFCSNTQILLT